VYEAGLAFLRDELGLTIREAPHARAEAATVEQRLADLHAAFADPDVRCATGAVVRHFLREDFANLRTPTPDCSAGSPDTGWRLSKTFKRTCDE
jgi:hypothetical protein